MSATNSPLPVQSGERKKVTTLALQAMKRRAERITMLTAYDYPTALAMDQAGIDVARFSPPGIL